MISQNRECYLRMNEKLDDRGTGVEGVYLGELFLAVVEEDLVEVGQVPLAGGGRSLLGLGGRQLHAAVQHLLHLLRKQTGTTCANIQCKNEV